jgi:beta-galactosidase
LTSTARCPTSTVWLNGVQVRGRPYGYSSFRVDLTPHLHAAGQMNTLAVRLDNKRLSARWYPGVGLYRNVWLVKAAPVHVRSGDLGARRNQRARRGA